MGNPCESLYKRHTGVFMKFIVALVITFTFFARSHAEDSYLLKYYEISEPEVVKISDEWIERDVTPFLRERCSDERVFKNQMRLEGLEVVEDVINFGEKVWSIVKEGKPSINYEQKSANALPALANCAFDLTNWNRPKASTYEVTYKNGFNMTVVSMVYKVIYTYGGKWQGAGSYLANVSIQPNDIYVSWGFSFNAKVVVDQVINLGSSEDPVAGLQISLEWDVLNPITANKAKEVFFVGGEGEITQL